MTDIVERLRFHVPRDIGTDDLRKEAADEIERLRHLLQNGSPVVEGTIQHMAMEIANLKKERDEAVSERNSIWESYKECRDSNHELRKEVSRLSKIEQAAVWACDSPQWRGDDFDNCMYALDAALKGEK